MRNIYKIVGFLALTGVLIGFFFTSKSPPALPDTQPNIAPTETRSESKSDVQTTPTVEDPFKKFLDQKAGSSNTVTKSDNAQGVPVQPGKDPFKEFLDKQKQNSKDQVVSPFGKNWYFKHHPLSCKTTPDLHDKPSARYPRRNQTWHNDLYA